MSIAHAAARQLGEFARGNANFFLAVGFTKPHLPFISPARLFSRSELSIVASDDETSRPFGIELQVLEHV